MGESRQATLVGWKAIAAYLGKDVRTAMRWKSERNLPVIAAPDSRGSVRADPEQLDAWLCSLNSFGGETATRAAAQAPTTDPPESCIDIRPQTRTSRRSWILLVQVVVPIGSAILAATPLWNGVRGSNPARAEVRDGRLSVWDEDGRLMWTYDSPATPANIPSRLSTARHEFMNPVTIDLDGDSHNEVLVVATSSDHATDERARDELLCFESNGRIRWPYRPARELRFGSRVFDGPWYVSDMLVVQRNAGKPAAIWLAVNHEAAWPAFVVRLSASGVPTPVFVNSGPLYSLATLRNQDESVILAGGANEEYASAALAVVSADSDAEFASPPIPGSPQMCDGCAQLPAQGYYLLPPSEVSRHIGNPYNIVFRVAVTGTQVQIVSAEVPMSSWNWIFRKSSGTIYYELSNALHFTNYSMGDGYWDRHQQLEVSGLVRHAIWECPEFAGPRRIRVWRSGLGWAEQEVPPAPGLSWAGQAPRGVVRDRTPTQTPRRLEGDRRLP